MEGRKWLLLAIGKGTILGCLIACLFYQSLWGLLFVPVGIAVVLFREKKAIRQALEKTGGNKSAAIALLKTSRQNFYQKIKKYGLE